MTDETRYAVGMMYGCGLGGFADWCAGQPMPLPIALLMMGLAILSIVFFRAKSHPKKNPGRNRG